MVIELARVAGIMIEPMARGGAIGFIRSLGIAETKYQYHGEVPHAEAPAFSSDGNTFDTKAANSGQSGCWDCQRKVSRGIVNTSPRKTPSIPARMSSAKETRF